MCVCFFFADFFFTNQLVLWVRSILWIDVTLCRSRCRLREESCLSEIERVGKGLYFQKYLRFKHELSLLFQALDCLTLGANERTAKEGKNRGSSKVRSKRSQAKSFSAF